MLGPIHPCSWQRLWLLTWHATTRQPAGQVGKRRCGKERRWASRGGGRRSTGDGNGRAELRAGSVRNAREHQCAQLADKTGEVLHDMETVCCVRVARSCLASKGLEAERDIRRIVWSQVDKRDLMQQEHDGGIKDAVHVWEQQLGPGRDLGQPSTQPQVSASRLGALTKQVNLRVTILDASRARSKRWPGDPFMRRGRGAV